MDTIVDILRSWGGGGAICLAFDLLVLNNNGAFSSLSNLHDTDVLLDKKKYHFSGEYTYDAEREHYLSIVDKIKRLDLFAYKVDDVDLKTVVHKKNKIVEQDEVVAITTYLIPDIFYITSYEKISVLEETENSLTLCVTTCSENIVNGYYRFKLRYDAKTQQIQMKYSKIQSFTTLPLRLLIKTNESSYIEDSKTSVINTFNYLFGVKTLNILDVKYDYK
jgi:hypothetical protein